MQKLLSIIMSLCLLGLYAQAPVKIVDGNALAVNLGPSGSPVVYAMQLVPNSATAVTATATYVQLIVCANTSASAVTILLTNTAGTTYYPTVSLPANSSTVLHSSVGMYMNGIKWTAGTSSVLYCQIQGVQ
jgi:hypothetical protein